jgi:NADH-quinone oxidoreductase subunit N
VSEALRNLVNVLPEALLVLVATAIYVAGTFGGSRRVWGAVATAALAAAGVLLFATAHVDTGLVSADPLAVAAKFCFLVAGLLFVGLSWGDAAGALQPTADRPLVERPDRSAEYFASLLLVVAGTMLASCAADLVLLFLGLELISIPTYLLLYLVRHDATGQETATKYFFLSVLSSAFLLYGFSFLYGVTGSTRLEAITASFASGASTLGGESGALPLVLLALALIFAGLGFKVAAVPFHAPDVYQGTTPMLAGLLAFAPKAAGFIALLRVATLTVSLDVVHKAFDHGAWLAILIAMITMTGGNVLALLQDNVRRLLAYSSIAHAGYLMIAVAVGFWDGFLAFSGAPFAGNQAVLFYLVAYGLATIGAFGVLVYLSRTARPVDYVDDLAGLGWTHPLVGMAMAVFLFSLTGIPPLAGFWAKLAVFYSALSAGSLSGGVRFSLGWWFYAVAVVGVVNAAIAAVYYLRVIRVMYLRGAAAVLKPGGGRPAFAAVVLCAVLIIVVGLFPRWTLDRARLAADAANPAIPVAATIAHRTE